MKIAVLADIHGNMVALQAVIDYANGLEIDHFIIAGDLISDCPHPKEVLDKVSELKGWIIQGNREGYVLDAIDNSDKGWEDFRQVDSLVWTRNQLEAHHIEYIRGLPTQASIQIENRDAIRVVHGSTEDVFEHTALVKEERLNEIVKGIDEKVLICGHSHRQWSKETQGKLVINPGSVGIAFNEQVVAEFSVLSWIDSRWKMENHKIPYDMNQLEEDFKSSGLLDHGGIYSQITVQSLREGVNRNLEFVRKALALSAELGYSKEPFIPNAVWARAEEKWRSEDGVQTVHCK